jgi:hypothetical protein
MAINLSDFPGHSSQVNSLMGPAPDVDGYLPGLVQDPLCSIIISRPRPVLDRQLNRLPTQDRLRVEPGHR